MQMKKRRVIEQRTEAVMLRLTMTEKTAIKNQAEKLGMTVTQLIRNQVITNTK
jgi:predicted DNA binding CopG/RHH family protein